MCVSPQMCASPLLNPHGTATGGPFVIAYSGLSPFVNQHQLDIMFLELIAQLLRDIPSVIDIPYSNDLINRAC